MGVENTNNMESVNNYLRGVMDTIKNDSELVGLGLDAQESRITKLIEENKENIVA